MEKLIECVPNFSEGRDKAVIKQITDRIESIEGCKLLNVDPGKATNRTVVTFAGTPDAVIEAAFESIKKAAELIDMSKHKGEHPRMGATDVCPLIPLSGVTIEEAVKYANILAARVGKELNIPVYLYEYAQPDKQRSNLSVIREGEYEGFFKKIKQKEWKPDYGPNDFPAHSGGTVIGVRDFLVAYNVNLNTRSVRRANAVAFDVRERGRIITDSAGAQVQKPGTLKAVKAIGWYIEEYGQAQVSINLTDLNTTPLHVAFEEVSKKANERGLRVTGSELVGLVPLHTLVEAGKYFLNKQNCSAGVSESELIHIAIKSLGLDELNKFDPAKRIVEYCLRAPGALEKLTIAQFADKTASESPAPGGGSVAAYLGALGAALGAMVANLSASKKGWENRLTEFSELAGKGQTLKAALVKLVDEDTEAFNGIMNAFKLPKSTEQEKLQRKEAVQIATQKAIEIPFSVMQHSLEALKLIKIMAERGNPNSVSDAGVGALCARSAVMGAHLNVRINSGGIDDRIWLNKILEESKRMEENATNLEKEILGIVDMKLKA
ncbi:MAG: glutamate formimidoyltransferase [Bacteroidia bacterium]|jgi:glutamate formiminotransferase/formiminotetrahydrofolate cyclodeaminase|nr:glutamate formimidoyltransferase [Bacteroidia bacterium]